jgi:hypothetical protein
VIDTLHLGDCFANEKIPEAYYVHCYAHCLDLAVFKSCQLPIVRNTIDTVKDVSYALHYSSKRTGKFKTMLQQAVLHQLLSLPLQTQEITH